MGKVVFAPEVSYLWIIFAVIYVKIFGIEKYDIITLYMYKVSSMV